MNRSTHKQYLRSLRKQLPRFADTEQSAHFIGRHLDEIKCLPELNLDGMRDELRELYAEKPRGQQPRDPVPMLRALFLMVMMKVSSPDSWVNQLKENALLAVLCGFRPDDVPAVASMYAFIYRLVRGPHRPGCSACQDPLGPEKSYRRKLQRKPKKDASSPGAGEAVRLQLLEEENDPRVQGFRTRLQSMLVELGLKRSLEAGLLPYDGELDLTGDLTTLKAGASHRGRATCTCRQEGRYRCDCERDYTDDLADWGWDNNLQTVVFGYHDYNIGCSVNGHDLPLNIVLGSARETDHTLALQTLEEFRKTLKEHGLHHALRIRTFISDCGVDGQTTYDYLDHHAIKPVIPLNQRGAKTFDLGDGTRVDATGCPICPGGMPMKHLAYDTKQQRHIYGCPAKVRRQQDGKKRYVTDRDLCPRQSLCQPDTATGPNRTLRRAANPRLLPEIRRGSRHYKKLKKLSSGIERVNSYFKHAHDLRWSRVRWWAHRLLQLFLIGILAHVRACIAHRGLGGDLMNEMPPTLLPASTG